MDTLHPQNIKLPGIGQIEKLFEVTTERYQRIRDGIVFCFKKWEIPPILIYKMANELETVAMKEYQDYIVQYIDYKYKNENQEFVHQYNLEKWLVLFDNDNINMAECWKKIVSIIISENIKPLELHRIANEVKTTSMEQFILAVGQVIETKK